jgi:DNA-binding IscR family transcriptional regulator
MREVVEGIEGPIVLHESAISGDPEECPGLGVWLQAQSRVLETLDQVTIADLAKQNGKSKSKRASAKSRARPKRKTKTKARAKAKTTRKPRAKAARKR